MLRLITILCACGLLAPPGAAQIFEARPPPHHEANESGPLILLIPEDVAQDDLLASLTCSEGVSLVPASKGLLRFPGNRFRRIAVNMITKRASPSSAGKTVEIRQGDTTIAKVAIAERETGVEGPVAGTYPLDHDFSFLPDEWSGEVILEYLRLEPADMSWARQLRERPGALSQWLPKRLRSRIDRRRFDKRRLMKRLRASPAREIPGLDLAVRMPFDKLTGGRPTLMSVTGAGIYPRTALVQSTDIRSIVTFSRHQGIASLFRERPGGLPRGGVVLGFCGEEPVGSWRVDRNGQAQLPGGHDLCPERPEALHLAYRPRRSSQAWTWLDSAFAEFRTTHASPFDKGVVESRVVLLTDFDTYHAGAEVRLTGQVMTSTWGRRFSPARGEVQLNATSEGEVLLERSLKLSPEGGFGLSWRLPPELGQGLRESLTFEARFGTEAEPATRQIWVRSAPITQTSTAPYVSVNTSTTGDGLRISLQARALGGDGIAEGAFTCTGGDWRWQGVLDKEGTAERMVAPGEFHSAGGVIECTLHREGERDVFDRHHITHHEAPEVHLSPVTVSDASYSSRQASVRVRASRAPGEPVEVVLRCGGPETVERAVMLNPGEATLLKSAGPTCADARVCYQAGGDERCEALQVDDPLEPPASWTRPDQQDPCWYEYPVERYPSILVKSTGGEWLGRVWPGGTGDALFGHLLVGRESFDVATSLTSGIVTHPRDVGAVAGDHHALWVGLRPGRSLRDYPGPQRRYLPWSSAHKEVWVEPSDRLFLHLDRTDDELWLAVLDEAYHPSTAAIEVVAVDADHISASRYPPPDSGARIEPPWARSRPAVWTAVFPVVETYFQANSSPCHGLSIRGYLPTPGHCGFPASHLGGHGIGTPGRGGTTTGRPGQGKDVPPEPRIRSINYPADRAPMVRLSDKLVRVGKGLFKLPLSALPDGQRWQIAARAQARGLVAEERVVVFIPPSSPPRTTPTR